jgi:hypothetical protein
MGIPAQYMAIYEGGYEVRVLRRDIPIQYHTLSFLHQLNKRDGEFTFFVDSLQISFITPYINKE